MTRTEYKAIPPDEFRHEIIDGQEFVTPAPDPPYQAAAVNIGRVLFIHVVSRKLGRVFVAPADVVLSEHDVVQPDAFFITESRARVIGAKTIEGAPDLVVEVASPSTSAIDRGPKLALYERAGVAEYWLADPAGRIVEVHEFGSTRRTRVYKAGQWLKSALLPGISFPVSDML